MKAFGSLFITVLENQLVQMHYEQEIKREYGTWSALYAIKEAGYLVSWQQRCPSSHQAGQILYLHHLDHPGLGLQAVRKKSYNQSCDCFIGVVDCSKPL